MLLADDMAALRARGYAIRPREVVHDEAAELMELLAWLADQRNDTVGKAAVAAA
jgi:hypothetical protein